MMSTTVIPVLRAGACGGQGKLVFGNRSPPNSLVVPPVFERPTHFTGALEDNQLVQNRTYDVVVSHDEDVFVRAGRCRFQQVSLHLPRTHAAFVVRFFASA